MRQSVSWLRRGALVVVALASVLCATFLVWRLGTRDGVGNIATTTLLAIVALFVLPLATWGAWHMDRKAFGEAPPSPKDARPTPSHAPSSGRQIPPPRAHPDHRPRAAQRQEPGDMMQRKSSHR